MLGHGSGEDWGLPFGPSQSLLYFCCRLPPGEWNRAPRKREQWVPRVSTAQKRSTLRGYCAKTRTPGEAGPESNPLDRLNVLFPFYPLTAAKVASLQATVVLLLMLLIKSNLLRVKMSLVGSLVGLVLLTSFMATTGLLTAVTAGSIAYGLLQKKKRAQTV